MHNIYTIALCALLLGFGMATTVSAQTIPPQDLQGYAWSQSTGWISLNCNTGGATGGNICGTSNYKVTINSDRTVTGYAWSPNIGWIRFGGLSGFPTTWGGATQANVTVTGSYPNYTFQGFARACAGMVPSASCNNMSNSTTSGGWTGWISMNGTNHTIQATADTGAMSGSSWAWGSDLVMGWIDMFTHVSVSSVSVSIDGDDCIISIGNATCDSPVTWSIPAGTTDSNVYNLTTGSRFSDNDNGPGTAPITFGSNILQARSGNGTVLASDSVNATCAGTWDGSLCQITINPPPTVTIVAEPPVTRSTRTVNIAWTITDLLDGSCRINGPGITPITTTTSGNVESASLTARAQYRIQCTGTYGVVSADTFIDIVPEGGES